ncbi:DUF2971 domain-containing protein [Labilibacter sediminis]|nr:DUF2971 domain-containing protein [Labilibacter sediminis]
MELKNDDKWIFKYNRFNIKAISILTNGKLWFGKPDIQNDPNEAEFIFELDYPTEIDSQESKEKSCEFNFKFPLTNSLKGRLNEISGEMLLYEDLLDDNYFSAIKELEFLVKEQIRNNIGICSFSKKFDDILMWSHYSESNQGICIVFNKELLLKNMIGQTSSGDVNYVKKLPVGRFSYSQENVGTIKFPENFILNKFINWEYEKEFRLVIKPNQSFLTINETLKRLVSFPIECIEGIIVGHNMSINNFETLYNVIISSPQLSDIKLFQSFKDINDNKMKVRLLDAKDISFKANVMRAAQKKNLLFKQKQQKTNKL